MRALIERCRLAIRNWLLRPSAEEAVQLAELTRQTEALQRETAAMIERLKAPVPTAAELIARLREQGQG